MNSGLFEFSHLTRYLMNSRQRLRGVSSIGLPLASPLGRNRLCFNNSITSVRKFFGHSGSSGSGINEANTTARHAASGRRAHQMCSVEMCPCRIDFSRADCSETSFSGRATSIKRLSISFLLLRLALFVPLSHTSHHSLESHEDQDQADKDLPDDE